MFFGLSVMMEHKGRGETKMADTHIDTEVYKPIRGYEGEYQVTSLGRVYSQKRHMFLAAGKNTHGYMKVRLCMDGKGKTTLVHKLVAEAFLEKHEVRASEKLQVDHIDQVKTNNAVWNLRWCTSRANQLNRGLQRNNSSGFIGVSWAKRENKWRANTRIEGKVKHLGYFDDAETAARVRDIVAWFTALTEEREFLVLNFEDQDFDAEDTDSESEEDLDIVEVSAYDAESVDDVPPFHDMRLENAAGEVELT